MADKYGSCAASAQTMGSPTNTVHMPPRGQLAPTTGGAMPFLAAQLAQSISRPKRFSAPGSEGAASLRWHGCAPSVTLNDLQPDHPPFVVSTRMRVSGSRRKQKAKGCTWLGANAGRSFGCET